VFKYHAIRTYGEVETQLHTFVTSALEGGEWSASHTGYFTPGGKSYRSPLDGRLGGPHSQPRRGDEEKKSLHFPCRELNLVVQPVA
jgi:hypothetical protein